MDINLLNNYYIQEQQRLNSRYHVQQQQQQQQNHQQAVPSWKNNQNHNGQLNSFATLADNLNQSSGYSRSSQGSSRNQSNNANNPSSSNSSHSVHGGTSNNSNSNGNRNGHGNNNNNNDNSINGYKKNDNQTKQITSSNAHSLSVYEDNDYSNNYIHSGNLPINYVRNVENPVEGYPKLQRLFQLKEKHIEIFNTRPYGCRVEPEKIVSTLNNWVVQDKLQFEVIMIGALVENQFIQPLLTQFPIHKLCSRPGFLFIWATTQKIQELTKLLHSERWGKKFRRAEELVFVPVGKDSPYYPNKDFDNGDNDDESLFQKMQWHCWMCMTGTVTRTNDSHLIHCNVDTDLRIENDKAPACVPPHIYKVAENFSSGTRRLHIIPSRTGFNQPVKLRPGWVILSPDVMLDNFDPVKYKQDISSIGNNVPETQEIDELRPKTPPKK